MKPFKVIKPESAITIMRDDDEIYHIIPSGFADEAMRYLVIDLGPHFNGDIKHMSRDVIAAIYGIDVTQPEFDK